MNYSFHPHAEKELEEVEDHYDSVDKDLGNRLRAEIEAAITRILTFPNAWQPLSARTRRCRLNSFRTGLSIRELTQRFESLP
jgi:toxin ParE1/3/4